MRKKHRTYNKYSSYNTPSDHLFRKSSDREYKGKGLIITCIVILICIISFFIYELSR